MNTIPLINTIVKNQNLTFSHLTIPNIMMSQVILVTIDLRVLSGNLKVKTIPGP